MSPHQASDCEAMEHVLSVLLIISRNPADHPKFDRDQARALIRPSSQPWPSSVHKLMLRLLSVLATAPGMCDAIGEIRGFKTLTKLALQEEADSTTCSLVVGVLWRMAVDLDTGPSIGSLTCLSQSQSVEQVACPPEPNTTQFPPGRVIKIFSAFHANIWPDHLLLIL